MMMTVEETNSERSARDAHATGSLNLHFNPTIINLSGYIFSDRGSLIKVDYRLFIVTK